jgi:DNA-binding NtrC family response regulator
MKRILIIEDEHALASALATVSRQLGCEPTVCFSGERARQELTRGPFAVVILDIGLPDMNGLTLLEHVNGAKVLVITAHGNLQNAVTAKQRGAAAYLVKPLDLAELQRTLQELLDIPAGGRASRRAESALPTARQEPRPPTADNASLLIGAAAAMQRVFVDIAHASVTDAPVLITGPTGTGKTLAARVIHQNSGRRDGPFVTLHCSAFPEQLLESELFGHEKNAFTGAMTARPGHIERAAGGTLLLDEIADIPLAMQAKLLRFVEDKTFVRVGGREDIRVDLRLIVATNKDLRAEVQAGRFREDLYYRLRVLEIEIPALASRKDDIPALSAFFLGSLAPQRRLRLTPETLDLLACYSWPGNVRELRNTLERAIAVSSGSTIRPQDLPREICGHKTGTTALEQAVEHWLKARIAGGATYRELEAELEACVLKHLLKHFDHKPTVLARVVKMNRATLLKKRRQHGVATA